MNENLHPILAMLVNSASSLHQLLSLEKGLTITDRERQLVYIPGKYGKLEIEAGDLLLPESVSLRCMAEGRLVTKKIEQRLGWDYIGRAVPVRDGSGDILGSIGTVEVIRSNSVRERIVVGGSSSFRAACEQACKAAQYDVSVLILGETGTGKEIMARLIVEESTRYDKPFVSINCACIPPALFESEMFGYESGAFTGAHKNGRLGHFELAHTGTIFLDEIGELDMNLQAKLLRTLETGKILRVGGSKEISVDVRVIAATNRNLAEYVRKEKFRADLYFRLSSVIINIPNLKSRREDIPLYVDRILHDEGRKLHKEHVQIEHDALSLLCEYDFPGNIRELQNIIKRALISCDSDYIAVEHIAPQIIGPIEDGYSDQERDGAPRIPAQMEHTDFTGLTLDSMERRSLEQALRIHSNKSKAARMLGISRDTLYRKIKKYKL